MSTPQISLLEKYADRFVPSIPRLPQGKYVSILYALTYALAQAGVIALAQRPPARRG